MFYVYGDVRSVKSVFYIHAVFSIQGYEYVNPTSCKELLKYLSQGKVLVNLWIMSLYVNFYCSLLILILKK